MPGGYARYVLAIMVAINFLNFADRWVASAAAPLIQAEFHLDDFRVGLLGSAFLLVDGMAAIPFGIWADRGIRKVAIGVGVLLWSCATVVSGLVANYGQLLASRTFLGVGEAGYYAAGNSLLGDYFSKESRGRAMSIWNAGSALGIAVGFAGGGFVASAYGWRAAFFFAAVPGLVLSLAAFTLRDPLRGAAERMGPQLQQTRQATLEGFRELTRIRSLRARRSWLAPSSSSSSRPPPTGCQPCWAADSACRSARPACSRARSSSSRPSPARCWEAGPRTVGAKVASPSAPRSSSASPDSGAPPH